MAEQATLKRRAWLGQALAGGAALAGCSGDDGKQLRFWAMGSEGAVAAQLLAGFEREHPGLRVRIDQLPWSAAHEKLLTAVAGDATPDLAQMGNTWLPEMQALGALAPLQTLITATPGVDAADHFDGIWQTNLVGDQRVGVPWYVDTRLLFVRRDLLARAGVTQLPTTRADWLSCMTALQVGPDKMTSPLFMPTNEFEPLLVLALQQGDDLLRDGGRYGNFSSPGFREALRFYLSLFERGFAPRLSNTQVANVWQEFGRGSFAFYLSGPWNIGEFKRRLPVALQGDWITAPLPAPTAGSGPGISVAGGSSLVIFKRSPRKALAWQLIEYLSRPAVQLQFYQLTGNLPPRRSSWALPLNGSASLADDRHAKAFAQQLERVRPTPAVPQWERIVKEMQLFAARAAATGVSIDDTVRGLDARVDAILEKRRWMLDRAGVGKPG